MPFDLKVEEKTLYELLRLEEDDLDWLLRKFDEANLPKELRERELRVFARIVDSRMAALVRRKVDAHSGGVRWAMGLMQHWVQRLERQAYLDHLVAEGKAELISPGRYRWRDGQTGASIEEFIEWTIPGTGGRRLDHAMINHTEKTICVTDTAAQLRKEHVEKGLDYMDKLLDLQVNRGPHPRPTLRARGYSGLYAEFYWDEQSDRLLTRNLRF